MKTTFNFDVIADVHFCRRLFHSLNDMMMI